MNTLSDQEREHVAIGAAVGAGCRPCTQYHVKAAVRLGLTHEDIAEDIEEAELVRIDAAMSTAAFARGLTVGAAQHESAVCSPASRSRALAQVGAATGANAGYLLDGLLSRARGLGLTDEALSEAVAVAGKVKDMAASFFARDAERALASGEVVAPALDTGGCTPAAGPADEPAAAVSGAASGQPSRSGCC
ncbi:MAG TPA: carboxymuconolactone decarboxylase family protein [Dehalococcoidia bacterium]